MSGARNVWRRQPTVKHSIQWRSGSGHYPDCVPGDVEGGRRKRGCAQVMRLNIERVVVHGRREGEREKERFVE